MALNYCLQVKADVATEPVGGDISLARLLIDPGGGDIEADRQFLCCEELVPITETVMRCPFYLLPNKSP